jgi:hypothetical protein
MNTLYIRRFHMADEYKTLYVRRWRMTDEHKQRRPMPAQLSRLQYVRKFPDKYKGHVAVPPNHARSTWPLCSSPTK